jgi:hypothetical protein
MGKAPLGFASPGRSAAAFGIGAAKPGAAGAEPGTAKLWHRVERLRRGIGSLAKAPAMPGRALTGAGGVRLAGKRNTGGPSAREGRKAKAKPRGAGRAMAERGKAWALFRTAPLCAGAVQQGLGAVRPGFDRRRQRPDAGGDPPVYVNTGGFPHKGRPRSKGEANHGQATATLRTARAKRRRATPGRAVARGLETQEALPQGRAAKRRQSAAKRSNGTAKPGMGAAMRRKAQARQGTAPLGMGEAGQTWAMAKRSAAMHRQDGNKGGPSAREGRKAMATLSLAPAQHRKERHRVGTVVLCRAMAWRSRARRSHGEGEDAQSKGIAPSRNG